MAKTPVQAAKKQIAAANMSASMATLAQALDKNTALADAMTSLADAVETQAMGSLTVYRMLVDEDNGGLSGDQLASLPEPETQGWDDKNPTVDGEYAGYSSNNPDWFKRPSLVPGVNKPAIVSAINLFSDNLLICRQWAETIAQAEKDLAASIIGQEDYDLIQGKFQGRIDRMRTQVRGAIKLGQNLAAAEQSPWDKVIAVSFAQKRTPVKGKDGKWQRDKANNLVYTVEDERTTTPIVIRALDDKGNATATHYRTIPQFNALDFNAALEDTTDAPGGTLQALFSTAQRGTPNNKNTIQIANIEQTQSAIYSLAGFLPDSLPAIGKILDKGGQEAMEYMSALYDVRDNISALLNVPARQKAYRAWRDANDKAEADKANAPAEAPAKVA